MRRVALFATACLLLTACSTRALRPAEDAWDIAGAPDGAQSATLEDRPARPAPFED